MKVAILSFFLSIWLVLIAITQIPSKLSSYIHDIDYFSLIPSWTFFAPEPGVTDYHLLTRIKLKSGDITPLVVESITNNKIITNAIWNPKKRKHKVLTDVVQTFARLSFEFPKNLSLTTPYLLILNYISQIYKIQYKGEQIQFVIAETKGFQLKKEPKIIFMSEFHEL